MWKTKKFEFRNLQKQIQRTAILLVGAIWTIKIPVTAGVFRNALAVCALKLIRCADIFAIAFVRGVHAVEIFVASSSGNARSVLALYLVRGACGCCWVRKWEWSRWMKGMSMARKWSIVYFSNFKVDGRIANFSFFWTKNTGHRKPVEKQWPVRKWFISKIRYRAVIEIKKMQKRWILGL